MLQRKNASDKQLVKNIKYREIPQTHWYIHVIICKLSFKNISIFTNIIFDSNQHRWSEIFKCIISVEI